MTARPILLLIVLFVALALPAEAQTQAPITSAPAAASSPVPGVAALSPTDIERVLAMLRDDAKRQEFVGTLEALLRAGGAAPEAPPDLPLPLAPNSLGAQVLLGLSDRLEQLSDGIFSAGRAFNDWSGAIAWFERVAESPWLREKALDALLLVALLVVVGLAGEWVVRRSLAPLRRRLGDAAGKGIIAKTFRSLARFALDLAPVVAFVITTYSLIAIVAPQLTTRLILLSVNNAWVIVSVVMCAARVLLAPSAPSLRMIPVNDETAAYLVVWLRRITLVAVFGYVAGEAGLVLGMDDTTHGFVLKLVWLVVAVFMILVIAQNRTNVGDAIRAPEGARGLWAGTRNRVADIWHVVAILYIVASWLVLAMGIPDGFTRMLRVSVATFVILGVAKGIEGALKRGMDRAFRVADDLTARNPGLEARVNRYVPVLRGLAIGVLWLSAILLLFEAWGIDAFGWFRGGGLGSRLVAAAISIGFTITLSLVIWESINAAIERHLAKLSRDAKAARSARVRTLMPMLRTFLLIAIIVVTALTILSEIGLNVAPLLAGAGVIGIAVGFGSQRLVQDVITGAFLLFEDAIAVGDVVSLGGQSGVVEALSIRSIKLRALDGSVHLIPFSGVTTVTNMTRDYGYAVFDITVAYAEDTDRVVAALKEIGQDMREEDKWSAVIREPLDVMGVEKLSEAAVTVRARFKTDPGQRWAVNREFLRRVKQRFDALGIENPNARQRVVVEGNASQEPRTVAAAAAAT
jgi:small-conductance mechanosensitive channel